MAEIALYRKYRPKTFAEVIGQAPVVRVLQSAVAAGRPAHAYLLAGSRGTGKTSVARILANALGTAPSDLYEIDAASNRGIDEIRALREAVRTLPFDSPYKVYIIDEVHMLTKDAFNALLKTLEEPPAHVIFILATTELHKVLETIVSRCQVFKFRAPSVEELKNQVLAVAQAEGCQVAEAAAELIALAAEGSFRDALGLLQKAVTISNDKKLSLAEVEQVTGAPRASLIRDYVTSLLEKKPAAGLAALRAAREQNQDMKTFLKLVLGELRREMLAKINAGQSVPITLPALLRECLNVYDELGRAYLPELPLELLLVKWSASGTI